MPNGPTDKTKNPPSVSQAVARLVDLAAVPAVAAGLIGLLSLSFTTYLRVHDLEGIAQRTAEELGRSQREARLCLDALQELRRFVDRDEASTEHWRLYTNERLKRLESTKGSTP